MILNLKWRFILIFVLALLINSASADEKSGGWWKHAEREASREGFFLMSTDEVKQLYLSKQPFLMVDVRPDYEFAMGHLPGAVNLEFHLGDRMRLDPGKKELIFSTLGPDKNRRVVIYCRSYS